MFSFVFLIWLVSASKPAHKKRQRFLENINRFNTTCSRKSQTKIHGTNGISNSLANVFSLFSEINSKVNLTRA